MECELAEDYRQLQALVEKFVARELLPLAMMAQQVRTMRIYEGPSEVRRMMIARRSLR